VVLYINFVVLLSIFAHFSVISFMFDVITFIKQSKFCRQWMVYGVSNATEWRTFWTDVQLTCKMLKCWQCVTGLQLLSVFCSVCDPVKEHKLLSFVACYVICVDFFYIIFQNMSQTICDFTFTIYQI